MTKNKNWEYEDLCFSLDIGTRTVIGIVGIKKMDKLEIVDYEIMEHPSRAMYDGQIHDIDRVSQIVREVKERLEKRIGHPLKRVAIAAAGRALKTNRVRITREIDYSKVIDKTLIDNLELEAVQKAQSKFEREDTALESKHYCVGYTVVNYYLNDGIITSLMGHKGTKVGVEIIATFLPHVVIDSLYSVMIKTNLEVTNLTLEPIAAINAAIPQKLRLLNLALIDIGAGTSDIAITKDGTIVAYGMASVAGDEITEALAKEFLLDFDTAEGLKLQLNKKDTHSFEDIVGINYTMGTTEIIERISSSVKALASEVGDVIISCNGKPPSAVFCIGGGSQIPTFTAYLAEKLGIAKERVVVRGTEIIEGVDFICEKLEGPEFITPIGIGLISLKNQKNDFIEVNLNGKEIKLLNAKALTISDVLIHVGYSARKLISRNGISLHVKVNGKERVINGELGKPARILLNNNLASLDSPLKDKDMITVYDAVDGNDAKINLRELIGMQKFIKVNGVEINLINDLLVNGKDVTLDYNLKDGDDITYKEVITVRDLFDKLDIKTDEYDVFVDDVAVNLDYNLKNRDKVKTYPKKNQLNTKVIDEVAINKDIIIVTVNDSLVEIELGSNPPIFVDIFKYIDFDITTPKGSLKLVLNGRPANYTDYIKDGDIIEIYWE